MAASRCPRSVSRRPTQTHPSHPISYQTMSDEEIQELVMVMDLTQTSNYCVISVLALLAYDHLLTFAEEVHFMWGRTFSGATVVFALNRYTTLIGKIILPVCTLYWPGQTDQTYVRMSHSQPMRQFPSIVIYRCAAPVILVMIFTVLAYWIAAVFSALRVYAIWDKDWRPFLLVFIIAMVVPVTNMYHYIRSVPSAAMFPFYGCGEDVELTNEQFHKLSLITHTCAIGTDLLVVLLTWIKTFEIKRAAAGLHLKTSLTTLLLRDGTLYFAVLVVLNMIHIIIDRSNATINPMATFIDAFTAILISRFMLNLREIARPSGKGGGDRPTTTTTFHLSQVTTLQIAHPGSVVGDLGAPLNHGPFSGSSSGSASRMGSGSGPGIETGWTGMTDVFTNTTGTAYDTERQGDATLQKNGPLWAGLLDIDNDSSDTDSEEGEAAHSAEIHPAGVESEVDSDADAGRTHQHVEEIPAASIMVGTREMRQV
ncbi:hypothetical protein C8Q74DRAFT_1297735 [Fomes fomentarius]|nr:hypothetical protein C8Q74DRAFT_1297735 [Fomes fomentarius]